MSQDPRTSRPASGVSREDRRRRLRAAQSGQPVPRATAGVAHEQRRLADEAAFASRKRRNLVIVVISFLVALGLLVSLTVTNIPPVGAAGEFDLKSQAHVNKFPEGIEFTLEANAAAPVKVATLQYTVDSGNGAIGISGQPEEFIAGTDVKAKYVHNTKKSYLPPGTRVSYYWEVEDDQGRKFKTDVVKFMQDDPRFKWKSVSANGVTAYWYAGNDAFGKSILDTTQEAIDRLSGKLGLTYDKPMMVWSYNTKREMDGALQPRSATYDQQIITLGQRTTAEIMLLLGSHSRYLDTISHEVGHMVVHQFAEGPLSTLPSWLDEGLAMNAQPTVEASYAVEIEQATRRNTLMSIRMMSSVAGDPAGVDLFYGQSYAVVKYLTDTYGQEKMAELLKLLKGGTQIDMALAKIYGTVTVDAPPQPSSVPNFWVLGGELAVAPILAWWVWRRLRRSDRTLSQLYLPAVATLVLGGIMALSLLWSTPAAPATASAPLDQDTLDYVWRKSVGAQPRPASERGRVDIAPRAVPTIGLMTMPQSNMPATTTGTQSGGGAAQPDGSQTAVAAGGGSMLFMAGAGLVALGLLAAGWMLVQGLLRKPNA